MTFEVPYDDASFRSYRPRVFVPTRTAVFTQSAFVSVSGYGTIDPEFESRQGQTIIIFSRKSTQLPFQCELHFFSGYKSAGV